MGWAFRTPKLRRILLAYTVNRMGTWFGLVALSLAVFEHTGSALAVAALLFAWQALPAFVVPAVVARVEASRRRRELSALYFFEAVTTGALAALLLHFWLPAVLLLAALDGIAALTATSLLRAEVARAAREDVEGAAAHVEAPAAFDEPDFAASADHSARERSARVEEAQRAANAALNIAFSTSIVLGPLLAGVVVAAAGGPVALLVDAASFLICGALLVDLHPHVEEAGGDSVRARLRSAWRHISETAALRPFLLAEAVALVFLESGGPIEVAYVKATLHAGDQGLGILLGTWGAGAVLGSLVFARLIRRSLPRMIGTGTVAVGLAYVGFAIAPTLALACVAAVLGGIGQSLQWPSLISIVQQLTPAALHGRLMGAVEAMGALCLAAGLILGGTLVALSSPRAAFLVVGVGAALSTAPLLHLALGRMGRVTPLKGPAG